MVPFRLNDDHDFRQRWCGRGLRIRAPEIGGDGDVLQARQGPDRCDRPRWRSDVEGQMLNSTQPTRNAVIGSREVCFIQEAVRTTASP